MTGVRNFIARNVKYQLRNLIYRYPPVGLLPERLHVWLGALKDTMPVPGDIAEIGCAAGGTAAVSSRMLNHLGSTKVYYCYDTFSGFVGSQFDVDQNLGTPERDRTMFDANSMKIAKWITSHHGKGDVRLIQGDIMSVSDDKLPPRISACLIDVDLSEPVYAALSRIRPRLSPGAIVIVDDCPEGYSWKARIGYAKFMKEINQPERYDCGLGVFVNSPAAAQAAGA